MPIFFFLSLFSFLFLFCVWHSVVTAQAPTTVFSWSRIIVSCVLIYTLTFFFSEPAGVAAQPLSRYQLLCTYYFLFLLL